MNTSIWIFAFLLVVFAGFYYVLTAIALKDLYRRPRVRTGNKVGWALTILCLPIVGAILYEYMGASGFLPRTASKPSLDSAMSKLKLSPRQGTKNPDSTRVGEDQS